MASVLAPVAPSLRCTSPPTSRARLPRNRLPALRVQATAAPSAPAKPEIASAVDVLKKAAADASVPSVQVFNALRELEQAKLQPSEDWPSIIGGSSPPGNRWRLVFTSGTKQVQEALKGAGKGGGNYVPLTACQRWDATEQVIENGIYLGRFAALTFKGPYKMDGKVLAFDFDTLNLRLGGWTPSFKLKEKLDPSKFTRGKKDPFFVFFYVDSNLICALGRGGGFAVWARTTPRWELKAGVV